jgi:hypothetical protein
MNVAIVKRATTKRATIRGSGMLNSWIFPKMLSSSADYFRHSGAYINVIFPNISRKEIR